MISILDRARVSPFAAAVALALVGCGAESGKPPPLPPPPPTLPRVVTSGGPVFNEPKIVPVFFPGDDPKVVAGVEAFLAAYATSDAWAEQGRDYHVHAMKIAPSVTASAAAPKKLDDAGIQAWLLAQRDAGVPAFKDAPEQAVFALIYPDGVDIDDPPLGESCIGFDGYHGSFHPGGDVSEHVVYLVIPRCSSIDGHEFGTDTVTAALSHELIETATDPIIDEIAYAQTDERHTAWTLLEGGEVADLCNLEVVSPFFKPHSLPHKMQRSWSNERARELRDPCVPIPDGSLYVAAAPLLPDVVAFGMYRVEGVSMNVGARRSIDVQLIGDAAATEPFRVDAYDGSAEAFGPTLLHLALDEHTGRVGEMLHLEIRRDQRGDIGAELFYVVATRDGVQTAWVGTVGD